MSDALISSLQAEINRLNEKNASLAKEAKDRRIKGKTYQDELSKLALERDALAKERDAFKVAAESGPTEHQARIAELEGTLRGRDHRDAFGSVKEFAGPDGKKYTLHPKATTEAVWTQLGYKPEGETPKGEAIAQQYGKALESHPYLFAEVAAPAPGGATRPVTVQAREGGPGAGKGSDSPTNNAASGSTVANTANYIPGRI